MSTELNTKIDAIKTEKDTKVIPGNVKSGVTMFGVTGTMEPAGGNDMPSITSNTTIEDGVKIAKIDTNLWMLIYYEDTMSARLMKIENNQLVFSQIASSLIDSTYAWANDGEAIYNSALNAVVFTYYKTTGYYHSSGYSYKKAFGILDYTIDSNNFANSTITLRQSYPLDDSYYDQR